MSLSILNFGKRYILTTLNFTGQSNFFVGYDHFRVFTYRMITAEFDLLFRSVIFFNFDVFVFPLMAVLLPGIKMKIWNSIKRDV